MVSRVTIQPTRLVLDVADAMGYLCACAFHRCFRLAITWAGDGI